MVPWIIIFIEGSILIIYEILLELIKDVNND